MYPWGDARPYHSYAAYCRRTFGRPIQKLPVDGGFTCPNRDGTVGHGGCSFCSNEAFTPAYCDPRRWKAIASSTCCRTVRRGSQ